MTERIIRTEKSVRGPFGQICKWVFIGFNALMLIWMISAVGGMGNVAAHATSNAEKAGAGLGMALGFGMILSIWAFGDVILGMFVLFTRGKRVIVEERHAS